MKKAIQGQMRKGARVSMLEMWNSGRSGPGSLMRAVLVLNEVMKLKVKMGEKFWSNAYMDKHGFWCGGGPEEDGGMWEEVEVSLSTWNTSRAEGYVLENRFTGQAVVWSENAQSDNIRVLVAKVSDFAKKYRDGRAEGEKSPWFEGCRGFASYDGGLPGKVWDEPRRRDFAPNAYKEAARFIIRSLNQREAK